MFESTLHRVIQQSAHYSTSAHSPKNPEAERRPVARAAQAERFKRNSLETSATPEARPIRPIEYGGRGHSLDARGARRVP
jgi:hypothetical protein